jgi:O-acetyl-ADP-ribose deacetylase (regulator of RNase III)
MSKGTYKGIEIELKRGDIANQPDMDAVVNAANAQLQTGGGVAGAIHRAAGPGLAEETRSLAPIKPGQAVISGGHNLPNDYVIHTLGPVYGRDKPEEELLANCYQHALDRAEENKLSSIAFPAISTGAFGYPAREAAKVALEAVQEKMDKLKHVKKIRFVLFGQDSYEVHEKIFNELFNP